MTKEHINQSKKLLEELYEKSKKLYDEKDGKALRDENAEIRKNMKSAWKTREIISPNKRVITTPTGTFFVTEENGQTIQLMKVDHLPIQKIMEAYFDFRS